MTALKQRILALKPAQRDALMRRIADLEAETLAGDWGVWAHDGQAAPEGAWRTWVMLAGRGFGKTRAGAEWVAEMARLHPGARIALVAANIREARELMVEGPSGLLALPLHRSERPSFEPSRGLVHFPDGAEAQLYSGANPEGLRGPQHHFAWCDELAKWRHPQAAWDMLQLGLRCGERPRALVTTTPRGGCAALGRILAQGDSRLTGGASGDNPHLPEAFIAAVEGLYRGTRMAREEIDGVLLEDIAGSLWPAALVERCRGAVPGAGELRRVVVGVDPPASAAGVCGIVVCALDRAGVGHVLADWSAGGLSPEGWARRVDMAAQAHGADRVVAEQNQGGEMVRAVLRGAGLALPLTLVSATRGKAVRAEPVAGLFEAGRAKFAGSFPELEEELAGLVAGGGCQGPHAGGRKSPDRADAMVWALWALLVAAKEAPRIVQL
ncbi:MAG: terminase family protein [Candidatus Andeanibacterium colombiense]|uniref:Terminase family protein n=1 Tax=Candidatus Andeanibacterium colombiense TaxID=3121345 RepID=A0AAJ5X9Z9_9SPHN|nr:MAG: terminase family protein [Sphingomonadaceae bacterium]